MIMTMIAMILIETKVFLFNYITPFLKVSIFKWLVCIVALLIHVYGMLFPCNFILYAILLHLALLTNFSWNSFLFCLPKQSSLLFIVLFHFTSSILTVILSWTTFLISTFKFSHFLTSSSISSSHITYTL